MGIPCLPCSWKETMPATEEHPEVVRPCGSSFWKHPNRSPTLLRSKRLKRKASSSDISGKRLKLFSLSHFIDQQYLASGSFGKIYKAIALLPYHRVQVAIKKVQLAENGYTNALKEAEILKHLHHPNIVAIYDIVSNRAEGELWIVMEFLNAGSLRGYCTGDKQLSQLDKLKISCDCWSALSYLHDNAKITHKDIKPENILIGMRHGRNLTAKLCDFGLATMSETVTQTQATTVTGTAMYFPPEFVESIRNPEKSDVYSMGASLCELFSQSYFWCHTGTQVPLTYPQIIGKLLTIWRHVKKGTVDKLTMWIGVNRIVGSSQGHIRKELALAISFDRQRRPCASLMRDSFAVLLRKEREQR